MNTELATRYAWFREHGGGWVGHSAEQAIALARAEMRAQDRLVCVWRDEDEEWDGDCDPPAVCLWGAVYRSEDVDDYSHRVLTRDAPLASLGMVGVDSLNDPYLRVCAAELFAEALHALDDEDQESANVLASRATFAGVSA